MVQLSHPYMTAGKTIALTRWTFAGKVMSLLFNMLSRLVITFLSRSKHLLLSWLQTPSFPPQLKKFLEKPVSTREEARESRPYPEEPRFRLLAREEGSFPCVFGKKFPAVTKWPFVFLAHQFLNA